MFARLLIYFAQCIYFYQVYLIHYKRQLLTTLILFEVSR